jgi:hypothetical protein
MSALKRCSLVPLGCKPNTQILFKKKNCIEVGVYEPEMIDLPRVTEPFMLKMMIEKKAHQVTKVFVKALNEDFVTVTYRSDPRRLGELFDDAYAVNYEMVFVPWIAAQRTCCWKTPRSAPNSLYLMTMLLC